jgi:hypothetical protein
MDLLSVIAVPVLVVLAFAGGMWLEHKRDLIKPAHEERLRSFIDKVETRIEELKGRLDDLRRRT